VRMPQLAPLVASERARSPLAGRAAARALARAGSSRDAPAPIPDRARASMAPPFARRPGGLEFIVMDHAHNLLLRCRSYLARRRIATVVPHGS
jgi:hypothetical protein